MDSLLSWNNRDYRPHVRTMGDDVTPAVDRSSYYLTRVDERACSRMITQFSTLLIWLRVTVLYQVADTPTAIFQSHSQRLTRHNSVLRAYINFLVRESIGSYYAVLLYRNESFHILIKAFGNQSLNQWSPAGSHPFSLSVYREPMLPSPRKKDRWVAYLVNLVSSISSNKVLKTCLDYRLGPADGAGRGQRDRKSRRIGPQGPSNKFRRVSECRHEASQVSRHGCFAMTCRLEYRLWMRRHEDACIWARPLGFIRYCRFPVAIATFVAWAPAALLIASAFQDLSSD